MTASDDLHSRVEQVAGKEHIPCPICGHLTWIVDDDAPMAFLLFASARALDASLSGEEPPDDDDNPGSSHYIHATCERCGFLRLHDVQVLRSEQT